MEIKGAYNEKTYKKEKEKEYGPKGNQMAHTTAGQFLQNASMNVPYYAFRPQKTIEQVKNDFLRNLKSEKATEAFYNSAVKTIRVIRQYFTIYYIDLYSVPESHLISTKHYKPSGEYSIDSKLEGDTLKVDVSQGKTYSHTSYDVETSRKIINKKDYYSYSTFASLENFSQKFYNTESVDESALIKAEEIMQDEMIDPGNPRYILGSDATYTLLQVLLFPIWRVECDFDGHTYVNYVSDVAPSKILYFELSQEEQAKREEIKRKEEQEERLKKQERIKKETILDSMCKSFGILVAISLIVHFLTGNVSAEGLGYCGFLVALLGKTFGGLITNILCGFGLVGIVFGVIPIIRQYTMEFKSSLVFYIIADCIMVLDMILYIISVVKNIGIGIL